MPNALYRINGGEVIKISTVTPSQTWPDIDTTYFGVLIDPTFPDGTAILDGTGAARVLGFAKFADVGGAEVRNAIQAEIDAFDPAETADENLQDAAGAEDLFLNHPRFRKLMTAYSDIIKDEINILRSWIVDFKAEVAAATSLVTLKTGVAGLPDLPDRTLAQLKTAIQNRISEND